MRDPANSLTFKKSGAVLLLFLALAGCRKEDINTSVLIRIQNQTTLKLDNVRIISYFDGEPFRIEKNYGSLNVNQLSSYQAHDFVRSKVEYVYNLSGAEKELSAWCSSGSTYLQNGMYTLVLRQDNFGNIYDKIIKN